MSERAQALEAVRGFTVHICDDCLHLRGEMCHEPNCRFCRRTMAEVAEYLNVLLIRPVIDGVGVIVDYGQPVEAPAVGVSPQPDTCGSKACARPDCGHYECQHVEYIGGAYEGNCRHCLCQEFVAPASLSPVEPTPEPPRCDCLICASGRYVMSAKGASGLDAVEPAPPTPAPCVLPLGNTPERLKR